MNPRTQSAVEHLTLPVSQGATYRGQSNSNVTCEVGNKCNPRSEWKLLGGEDPAVSSLRGVTQGWTHRTYLGSAV